MKLSCLFFIELMTGEFGFKIGFIKRFYLLFLFFGQFISTFDTNFHNFIFSIQSILNLHPFPELFYASLRFYS